MFFPQSNKVLNVQHIQLKVRFLFLSFKICVEETGASGSSSMAHVKLYCIVLFLRNFWMNAQLIPRPNNACLTCRTEKDLRNPSGYQNVSHHLFIFNFFYLPSYIYMRTSLVQKQPGSAANEFWMHK